jgi:hypothetical protein
MNSVLLLASLTLVQQAPVDRSTPKKVIEQMFERYSYAGSCAGTIKMTQSSEGRSAVINTYVQFRRPAELYIRQQQVGSGDVNLTIADGKWVTYEIPEEMPKRPGQRFFSRQKEAGKATMQVQDCYTLAIRSLLDRSTPLDIAVGKSVYLRRLTGQWATREFQNGNAPDKGEDAVIVGDFRDFEQNPVTGKYQMIISPAGDIKRFTLRETIGVREANRTVTIVTVWDADLKVGSFGDEKLYKVTR